MDFSFSTFILNRTSDRFARVWRRGGRARFPLAALTLCPIFLISAHAQSYSSELNLGVQAYKNSRYEEAIVHFRKATELDPSQANAHLYLATACGSGYIPGVQTEDNLRYAKQAIEQYQIVLDSDVPESSRRDSAKGIAYLYLNMKKFDEAKTYYQKASAIDPDDPEPHYSIGVIDWTASFQPRTEARAKLEMKPADNFDPTIPAQWRACQELRTKNMPLIEEGMNSLNEAILLRPDYDDAMAYLNLMYREKADLECDNREARQQDLKTADHWVDEVLRTKKMKAEKALPPSPSN